MSSIAKDLMPEAASILKELDWDGELLWIEKNVKDLHWANSKSTCIFCNTYQTNENLKY